MPPASVTIASPQDVTRAEFVPEANLVCASLRHAGVEHLHAGRGVEAYAAQGKTMGIPLLYPWANRLSRAGYAAAGATVELPDPDGRYPRDPNGLPIHGALPGMLRWEIGAHAGDRLHASLAWEAPDLLALFPFRHHVEVEAVVGDGSLTLVTSVLADGGDPVPVSFGYHPYLTLPGTRREDWRVTLDATERLELDDRMIPTGARTPLDPRVLTLGDTTFDDGLAGLPMPARFAVAGADRAIAVGFEAGYPWGQVFAPPGQDFICFEPMTAPADALNSGTGLTVLSPGDRYRARVVFTITS
jgi:aldose 1-epimerase